MLLFQLSGSSDVPGNAVKILDILIKYLVLDHIDYAVEIGLQGWTFLSERIVKSWSNT